MIAVNGKMATGTLVDPFTQGHLLPMVAPAAILTGVGRVDLDERSASFFRFAREVVKELRPRRVTDAFCQTMVVNHPVDLEVFDADRPEAVNDLPTLLMGEVLAPECNTLMHPRNGLAMLAPLWCAFRQFGVLALHLSPRLFFCTEEARVLNLFPAREGCKGFESHINTDLLRGIGQAFRFTFYREAHVPLARRGTRDGTRLDLPFDLTVIHHLDAANFREAHPVIMRDAKARLREGETIVAIGPTEARVSWVLTRLEATEEGFHGEINAYRDILQHLRVDTFERGTLLFEQGEGVLLLIEREGFPRLLIRVLADFQQVVIEPTALRKRLAQLVNLFLGRIESVLVGFTHTRILTQSRTHVKNEFSKECVRARPHVRDRPGAFAHAPGGNFCGGNGLNLQLANSSK